MVNMSDVQTEDDSGGSSIVLDDDESEDGDIITGDGRGGDPRGRQQQLQSRPARGRAQPDMVNEDDDDEDF